MTRSNNKPSENNVWRDKFSDWTIGGVVVVVLAAIILMFITPFISRCVYQLKTSRITPVMEVKIRNILITRGLDDKVFELKMGLHLVNKEEDDYSIELLSLKNIYSNDSLSLTDNESIFVPKGNPVDQQIEMTTPHFDKLFEFLPSLSSSGWQVTYKVVPTDKVMNSVSDSSTIACLHFYLLPLKFMHEVRSDTNFQVIWNIEEALDTTGGSIKTVGWDTVGFYFYPKNYIKVRMDQNLDKIPDKIVRSDSLKYHIQNFVEGKFLDVIVDYEGLKQNVSGIIIGMVEINNLLSHDYFRMKLFNPDSEKKLVQILEDCADNDIPLSYSEFIYYRFLVE